MSAATTIKRSPDALRPHALNHLPRWSRDTAEWNAFLEDIREHGIMTPLRITEDGRVIDGETRRQAAVVLRLADVPCEVMADDQVANHIARELMLRRNLTKGQRAYVVIDLIDAQFADGAKRRLSGGDAIGRTSERFADQFAVSRRLLDQARKIRKLFADYPDLQEQFEPRILDFDDPIGLGAAIAGVSTIIEDRKRGAHSGGRPQDVKRQLELFTETWTRDLTARYQYWTAWDEGTRSAALSKIGTAIEGMPSDLLEQLDKRMRAEQRRRAEGKE